MSRAVHCMLPLLIAAVLLPGCAMERIHVRLLRPAPVNLVKHRDLAVDLFSGHGGDEFSRELVAALRQAENPVTGQAGFDVLDRRDIDRVLDDLRGRRGKRWNSEAMSVLDEWKNVAVILKGAMERHEVEETCSEETWQDQDGSSHTKYLLKAVANVAVNIEASGANSGEVLDSVRLGEAAAATSSAVDSRPQPIDHAALLATARRAVVSRYLIRVTPREEFVEVLLFKDGKAPGLHVGNGFARTGAWDEALQSYRDALDGMTGELAAIRYKALFNIGVALAYTNEFDEAKRHLKEAYALEQDDTILRELERVAFREEEYRKLLEQA